MKTRISQLVPKTIPGSAHVTTVHALCLSILRSEGRKFDILTDENRRRGLAEAAHAMELDGGVVGFLTRAGFLKNTGETAATYKPDSSHEDREFARAWKLYEKAKAQQNLLEFDDFLTEVQALMRKEESRAKWAAKYTHVIVDECQDMNRPQYQIVLALGQDHHNVMLVGDPDQTLYAFRGADLETFRAFSSHPTSHVFELRENFRSTPSIIRFAVSLIRQDLERRTLEFVSTRPDGPEVRWNRYADVEDEAITIAEEIKRLADRGACFRDIAVLYRLNAQAEAIERNFAAGGVPFIAREDGDFYSRKEIAGMLAYLEFFRSYSDEWLLSFLNLPNRKLSRSVGSALRTTAEFKGKSIWEILPDFYAPDLKSHRTVRQMQRELEHVNSLLTDLGNAGEAVKLIRKTLEFDAWLRQEEMNDRDNDRIQNLQRMEEAAARYPTIDAYLTAVRKVREETAKRKSERAKKRSQPDAVVLSTGHAAKGLEWRYVFAAGWSEELLPHRKAIGDGSETAIAEERRIAYVMATRARDYLSISSIDYWNGANVEPSRFLTGLQLSSGNLGEDISIEKAEPNQPLMGGLFAG